MCIIHSFIYSFMNCALILLITSALKENSWKIMCFGEIHSYWAILDLYFQNFMDSTISNPNFFIIFSVLFFFSLPSSSDHYLYMLGE